jgi:hypothetical protein
LRFREDRAPLFQHPDRRFVLHAGLDQQTFELSELVRNRLAPAVQRRQPILGALLRLLGRNQGELRSVKVGADFLEFRSGLGTLLA